MVDRGYPVSLFAGSDTYSKEKAIEALVSSILDTSARQLDYKVFYGDETGAEEIFDYLSTLPFRAPKRVALVRGFDRLEDEFKARLTDYIKRPSRSACLILESKNDPNSKDLERFSGSVDIRRFKDPAGFESASWIRGFLSSRGKKEIEPEAIEMLRELQGSDMLSISQELEKLIAFAGERPVIKASDVEEVVGKSLIVSAFELTDAIERNKVEDALRIVSDLTLTGKKHYEIIGLLCWYLRRLVRAKALQMAGQSEYAIAGTLKIGRRYQADFFEHMNRLDISRIRSKIDILVEADLDIKRTKFDPKTVLEFAIIRLCLSRP
ncbi:MAG: DNA polymerase III subunit delta [Candidatus Omnitrophota bacterium]